jgi:hypothetical protein
MLRPRRVVYSLFCLPLLAGTASAQTSSGESQPAPQEQIYGGCLEAPAPDAPPSMCVPALAKNENDAAAEPAIKPTAKIDLRVPQGTTLRIALDQRTRISHPGDAVHGKVIETVYAFDQPVIPAGSVATGRVIKVDSVPAFQRTMAYANGNFSPFRKYNVTFDTVTLPDGKQLSVATTVSTGTTETVHLVSSSAQKQKTAAQRAKEAGTGKVQEAKDEMHKSWDEVTAPGKMQRLKGYIVAQSPYRHQYIEPGTRFNADLDTAISFGEIRRTSDDFTALASALPPDTTLKARLVGEVSSATATRGTRVEAVLTEPLYTPAHQLILPVNSRILGQVVQAKAAQKFHHNGELRLIFERIEIPVETERAAAETAPPQVEAQQNAANTSRPELTHRGNLRMTGNIEGVEVDRRDHMVLDEEGGARTTDPKTRYLSTGVAILLAAAASHTDSEHGTVDSAGDPGVRTAAGGSGFRLVGAVISLGAKSHPLSAALGVYGASSSVYANFLSRGHEVVFPKDTSLEIGFGSPHSAASQAKP